MFGEKGDGAWFTLEDPEEDERKSLLRSNLQKLIPILKREKFKLTDEEYKEYQFLFKKIPQLEECIPNGMHRDVANNFMKLVEVQAGRQVVKKGDRNFLYIVLAGELTLTDPNELCPSPSVRKVQNQLSRSALINLENSKPEENNIEAGESFGDYHMLTKRHRTWNPQNLYAFSNVSLIYLDIQKVRDLLYEKCQSESFKLRVAFLERALPMFREMSRFNKLKYSRFFHEKTFLAGHKIIEEGTIGKMGYLIQEGECKIYSNKSPLHSKKREIRFNAHPKFIKNIRGLMSNSTHTFQLGKATEGCWVGEDVIFTFRMANYRFPYEVVAVTKVITFQLNREYFKQISKDLYNWFMNSAIEKLRWIDKRSEELVETNYEISKMNSLSEIQDKPVNRLLKNYPSASKLALSNIHSRVIFEEIKPREASPLPTKSEIIHQRKIDNIHEHISTRNIETASPTKCREFSLREDINEVGELGERGELRECGEKRVRTANPTFGNRGTRTHERSQGKEVPETVNWESFMIKSAPRSKLSTPPETMIHNLKNTEASGSVRIVGRQRPQTGVPTPNNKDIKPQTGVPTPSNKDIRPQTGVPTPKGNNKHKGLTLIKPLWLERKERDLPFSPTTSNYPTLHTEQTTGEDSFCPIRPNTAKYSARVNNTKIKKLGLKHNSDRYTQEFGGTGTIRTADSFRRTFSRAEVVNTLNTIDTARDTYCWQSRTKETAEKFFLNTASTFQVSHSHKILFPSISDIQKQRITDIKGPQEQKLALPRKKMNNVKSNQDQIVKNIRQEIKKNMTTFTVGHRQVTVINKGDLKRKDSPNPAKVWAKNHQVDLRQIDQYTKQIRHE